MSRAYLVSDGYKDAGDDATARGSCRHRNASFILAIWLREPAARASGGRLTTKSRRRLMNHELGREKASEATDGPSWRPKP